MDQSQTREPTLSGFTGPFREGLEPLGTLYQKKLHNLNLAFMNHVREMLPRPDEEVWQGVKTGDDYMWPYGILFHFYNRRILILLPNTAGERDSSSRSFAERGFSLYYQGRQLSDEKIERIMLKVIVTCQDAYEELYGPIV